MQGSLAHVRQNSLMYVFMYRDMCVYVCVCVCVRVCVCECLCVCVCVCVMSVCS